MSIYDKLLNTTEENRVEKLKSITEADLKNPSNDDWLRIFEEMSDFQSKAFSDKQLLKDFCELALKIYPHYKLTHNAEQKLIERTADVFKKLKQSPDFLSALYEFNYASDDQKFIAAENLVGQLTEDMDGFHAFSNVFRIKPFDKGRENGSSVPLAFVRKNESDSFYLNCNKEVYKDSTADQFLKTAYHELTHLTQQEESRDNARYKSAYNAPQTEILNAAQNAYFVPGLLDLLKEYGVKVDDALAQKSYRAYKQQPKEIEAHFAGALFELGIQNMMREQGLSNKIVCPEELLESKINNGSSLKDWLRKIPDARQQIKQTVKDYLTKMGAELAPSGGDTPAPKLIKNTYSKKEAQEYRTKIGAPCAHGLHLDRNPYHHLGAAQKFYDQFKKGNFDTEKLSSCFEHLEATVRFGQFLEDSPAIDAVKMLGDIMIDHEASFKRTGYEYSVQKLIDTCSKSINPALAQTTSIVKQRIEMTPIFDKIKIKGQNKSEQTAPTHPPASPNRSDVFKPIRPNEILQKRDPVSGSVTTPNRPSHFTQQPRGRAEGSNIKIPDVKVGRGK